MRVIFVNESESRVPRTFIQEWLEACIKLESSVSRVKPRISRPKKQSELTIVFLGSKQAQKINKIYRQRNYATDVLSFEGDGRGHFGELILCPAVISRQSLEHGLSFRQELGYLLLHGYLHLLGYDHEQGGAEARLMLRIQDEVFEKVWPQFWK